MKFYPIIPVIVSHELKFIYYWIPKIACSTIRDLLPDYEKIGRKDVRKYPDYFKFTFVRNPFDRLVSCYFDKILYALVGGEKIKQKEYLPFKNVYEKKFKDMSFDNFVRFVSSIHDRKSNGHFRSIWTFLDLDQIDFFGRFENFERDINVVKRKIGIKKQHAHLRKTTHDHYREYYNKEMIQLMNERYQKDLELFNYRF